MRVAISDNDFNVVAELRARGFGRLLKDAAGYSWLGESDYSKNTRVLIFETLESTVLGTMRIQDGRQTPVELASIVPLETLVDKSDIPFAQLARLSVPKSVRARDAMYALFKSVWKWTAQQQIRSLVIATPAWSRPMYKDLLFRDLGPAGVFLHWYGASVEHRSMLLNDLEQTWRKAGHPLSPLWFNSHHPQLDISGEP